MVIDNNRLDHTEFMIDGERISEVEEFVYLGSNITKECNCRTEVRRRLAMTRTATLNMTSIWKSRGVSTKLKTRLLRGHRSADRAIGLRERDTVHKFLNIQTGPCYRN